MGLIDRLKASLTTKKAEPAASFSPPEIPKSLCGENGEYGVIRRIMRRGYPEEFLGTAPEDGCEVELLLYHHDDDRAWWQWYADEKLRLVREIRHDGVARLIDCGWHGDRFFAVCERVAGPTLADLLINARRESFSFPLEFGAHVGVEVAAGLHAGHALPWHGENLELLHEKIVPWNIGFQVDGTVQVLDWGLDVAPPTSAGVFGPKIYAVAPEQAKGEQADARSDLFQLAALVFELLAGKRLFQGDNDFATLEMITKGHLPDFEAAIPSAPPELRRTLTKALALAPNDRHRNVAEFADELRPHKRDFDERNVVEILAAIPAQEPPSG